MKEKIKNLNLRNEFYTDEGCYIIEVSNTSSDPGLSIARARVEPGITTKWHRLHGITERYYILEGIGIMEAGNLPMQEVKPGDVILIPPMCRQRITNVGLTDLIFLAICTPRFRPELYEDIDSPEP
ncbi:MAG: glucose-6-phosphate isomerase [Smithella sp. PtaU1.Bin162]|nr:MAG: glucose-6-phosphate isomerase [Smithella sp. PtaU1.Bin162]